MLLTSIFSILLISLLILFFIPSTNIQFIRIFSLISSALVLVLSCALLLQFDCNSYYFQNVVTYSLGSELINLSFSFGLDGISIFFFILTSLLIFLCILFIWNERLLKEYTLNLLLIELLLLLVFSVLDVFLFYIFFEAILIPMFLLIGVWGSRERKIRAGYLLFFYTLFGSLLMLTGLLYMYYVVGTLNLEYLLTWNFTFEEQCWLWLAFFLSFASKIPMFPFHVWLPEAHVEAPTVGSVLLAGILLKLGVYGFLRFSLSLFPEASLYFSPLVYLLSVLGVIYASLSAIRQTDLKRIIAYSSVAHMNLVTLGIFSFNIIGLEGSILQSISHGFVSGGMFLLIGVLYDRYHSRLLYYYGGLVHMMPVYAVFLLIFTMANIALPGTSSFVGEFLLLLGIYKTNVTSCIVGALGVILCGAYSLWLYNRIIFGNLKIAFVVKFKDMNFREFIILLPLLILVIFMGVYPSFFSNFIHLAVCNLSLVTL
jgi:proton-translocating NADH-quinone oxidoreductase chain M|tara:strand:+ start:920 stop:2371 length:1452 start_codon:yes stop_codon:yes gene_type:complete